MVNTTQSKENTNAKWHIQEHIHVASMHIHKGGAGQASFEIYFYYAHSPRITAVKVAALHTPAANILYLHLHRLNNVTALVLQHK